jgi:hypothetical protein
LVEGQRKRRRKRRRRKGGGEKRARRKRRGGVSRRRERRKKVVGGEKVLVKAVAGLPRRWICDSNASKSSPLLSFSLTLYGHQRQQQQFACCLL